MPGCLVWAGYVRQKSGEKNLQVGKFMTELSELAASWVARLAMRRHPEGGYYAEVYRSSGCVAAEALPGHAGSRSFLSTIYFMLPPGDVSRFHRLRSDEIWYYHAGCALTIHCINGKGVYETFQLGPDLSGGHSLQVVVPAGTWFGATPHGPEAALVGCAVAPGFDFADFELADRQQLTQQYPQHQQIITALT